MGEGREGPVRPAQIDDSLLRKAYYIFRCCRGMGDVSWGTYGSERVACRSQFSPSAM